MNTLPPIPLPSSIRSRSIEGINGLTMHVLEWGFEDRPQDRPQDRPCVLLLHGFPELAFSWRKVMPALAEAGYHVLAPDQRGYGRTTGWDADYDGDLAPFRRRTWCATRLASYRRSAIDRSRPWSATISAVRSRHGAA